MTLFNLKFLVLLVLVTGAGHTLAGLKLEGDKAVAAVQVDRDRQSQKASVARGSTQDVVLNWQLKAGDNVKDTLSQWAAAAGWEGVSWEVPEIEARTGFTITGTFPEAVEGLIRALNEGGAGLHPIAYENLVLRIVHGRR